MSNPRSKAPRTSLTSALGASARARATRRTIALSVVVVVIVAAIAGFAVYRYQAPFNTVVLEVNDTQIRMRYFLKRVAMSGGPALNMLDILTQEQIIKLAAVNPPFSIAVTQEDIDRLARELARGRSATIEQAEFKAWYRQQLNETRLTDAEYRDLLRTNLLRMKMEQYLGQFVPSSTEQVFVNMIPVAEPSAGASIKERYETGAAFAALAREYSVDPTVRDAGGKIGWFPRGVLDPELDGLAFTLKIGSVSDAVRLNEHRFAVMMISERARTRQIDEQSLAVLKSKALEKWYKEAFRDFQVRFHGFYDRGYDSETDAWVNWQLMRMQKGQR